MTTIEILSALQKRVRETTGPDRELDVAIAYAFYPNQLWCAEHPFAPEDVAPNYTTDPDGLGACVALMREVLPGWVLDISVNAVLGWARVQEARLPRRQFPDGAGYCERANLCLSIIDVIIAARIAVIVEMEKADV